MKCRFFAFALALVVAPSVLCQEARPQNQEPLTPSHGEAAANLVGEMPVLRMDFGKFPMLARVDSVPIDLLVDEQGTVTSAKLEGEENAEHLPRQRREMLKTVMAEVEKIAMTLRFRPFGNGGHPVPARLVLWIPVRALEQQPAKHVPFPQVHNWNSLKIVLSRTGCYGACLSYTVEVHGDGAVLYEGHSYVAITGSHRASVSTDVVFQMVEAFRAADYFSLRDKYVGGPPDLPMYTTSIFVDGRTKQVVDYAGEEVGMPESVSKLEETIDHLSGVERWTKGNSETVRALMHEKFDFKSSQASEILANVARIGNANAVRELVAAGVIVSTTRPAQTRFRGVPGTALENAAQRGDAEMLRALLSTGIKDPEAKTEALKRAASAGKIDAVRLLITSGANPTTPNVLISAAASGIPTVVQEILKYKPEPNARGEEGTTAILACRLQGYHSEDLKEVVRMLLDAGADPNIADNDGETPLIANSQDLEIAQMLIAHGANVNARSKDGFTPLLTAETVELTRLLLEHGADPFAKTEQGQTALDLAKQMNHKDKAALLEAAMTGKKE